MKLPSHHAGQLLSIEQVKFYLTPLVFLILQLPTLIPSAVACRTEIELARLFDSVDVARLQNEKPAQVVIRVNGIKEIEDDRLPDYGRHKKLTFSGALEEPVIKRMEEMSEWAYVLDYTIVRDGTIKLGFKRDGRLCTPNDTPAEPAWLKEHRRLVEQTFPIPRKKIEAQIEMEIPIPEPIGNPLTSKTLQHFAEGTYAWVRLRGENFLRLAGNHTNAGAWEHAQAAGEITIKASPSGVKYVHSMNNRSGTYPDKLDYLINGINAMWRQGVYPRSFTIFRQDNFADKPNPVLVLPNLSGE